MEMLHEIDEKKNERKGRKEERKKEHEKKIQREKEKRKMTRKTACTLLETELSDFKFRTSVLSGLIAAKVK